MRYEGTCTTPLVQLRHSSTQPARPSASNFTIEPKYRRSSSAFPVYPKSTFYLRACVLPRHGETAHKYLSVPPVNTRSFRLHARVRCIQHSNSERTNTSKYLYDVKHNVGSEVGALLHLMGSPGSHRLWRMRGTRAWHCSMQGVTERVARAQPSWQIVLIHRMRRQLFMVSR
jgi:hypothetical protein